MLIIGVHGVSAERVFWCGPRGLPYSKKGLADAKLD